LVFDDDSPFRTDQFFQVPRHKASLSIGEVMVPAFCQEVSARMLVWLLPARLAAAKLAGTGLVPSRLAGHAVVFLSYFHYGRTTVGPYDEVGLLVLARAEQRIRRPARGLYAVELALTSEVPCIGGRELLGLSKYLTDVGHQFRGDRFSFSLVHSETGNPTLKVSGRIGQGVVVRSPPLVNLSNLGGEVLRTVVDTDTSWRIGRALDVCLRFDSSDGHLGHHVADLGLDGRRPLCVLASDDLRGRLNAGVPIARQASRRSLPLHVGA
jgi:hypothetical protein